MEKLILIQKLYKNGSYDMEMHATSIANLATEIWQEHYTPIIGVAQVDYMLAKFQSPEQIYTDIKENDYIYFIATDTRKDRLLGYCAVKSQEDFMLLSKLYVHSDFRGKGIARSFLDEAIALCKYEYGHDKIQLTVNKNNNAVSAYKKMGFEIIDSVKVDIGNGFYMDDYIMELEIEKQIYESEMNFKKE